ncbi:hypothetical protein [Pisciglobus halotolerans]|uniref:Uncharacterized protein n=1 Tax=Pisciglobus halotolerans TaxID=745365 RepID=A0A1I3CED2_9LACT|nr:hypothetical protein [Pisciglobus halotolerans]SFH72763.1 hypothetical protein SAMN04489868_1177 [Pisciglobus halotolerans]
MSMLNEQEINQLIDDAKKELDRVMDRRSEDLGNSVHFIENELQIVNLKGQITAYQQILNNQEETPIE